MKLFHRLANRAGFHLRRIDDLTRFMNQAGSDKGWGLRGRHYYTRIYHRLFQNLRDTPVTLVEIGLLRPDQDSRRITQGTEGHSTAKALTAPSLLAWRQYFKSAHIVGFDIDDFTAVQLPDVSIFKGDMSNPRDLRQISTACPEGIDILIDDGSHVSHHQQIAFAELFPHLKPGGLYLIEDCHWQDPSFEKPAAITTRALFQHYRKTGCLETPFIDPSHARLLAAAIADVRFHDSIEPMIDDTEDALCVIHKKS